MNRLAATPLVLLAGLLACTGELRPVGSHSGGGADAGVGGGTPDAGLLDPDDRPLDRDRAQARFVTTTDLMRYVFAPGCAAENDECHANEDFPDLHTEGNLWNLVDLPCNQAIGDLSGFEEFCERLGDQLRITSGSNQGFTARIGSIELDVDDQGNFLGYQVTLETAPTQSDAGAGFEILRDGVVQPGLGGGTSVTATGADPMITVTRAEDIPDPRQVRQGDVNQDGHFGDGSGTLIRRGAPRDSYLVRRMVGRESERVPMPLGYNADNPTEQNRPLSLDESYAVTSWIRCMEDGDGPYSEIRYDCAGNAGNDGTWDSW